MQCLQPPLVQQYLLTHTLAQLDAEHGVNARANALNDKFSLNYDMINVKNGDAVAEQCRGLILRPKEFLKPEEFATRVVGETSVLAWPMNRFYNHGDTSGADVDWLDEYLRVQEKLDGTMIVAYWDELHGMWHAATRAVPEADLPIKIGHMEIGDATFSDLFWRGYTETCVLSPHYTGGNGDSKGDPKSALNKNFTYVFELTSPYNRVVVKYDEPRVTLLAVRSILSSHEIDPTGTVANMFIPTPATWPLRDASSIQAFVEAADPAKLEGCVVIDSQFRRLKIKNKAWVLASRAKATVTDSYRNALESIITGTIDDVIPLVEPQVAEELSKMQLQLAAYCRRVDIQFKEWEAEALGNRKRFAELVNLSNEWASPYFLMLDKRAPTSLEWLRNMQKAEKLSTNIIDTVLSQIKNISI